MEQPLVSVVVPALNVGRLLPRCLESLLGQTYRPIEILVVDDGSTDDTGEVMRRYADRHPEIHTISQRHRGLGPARNAALSIAHGTFVSMIDADDWVEPDFIADMVRISSTTGADVVVAGFRFDALGLSVPFPFLPRAGVMAGTEAAELSLHLTRFPSFAWNKFYRRTLFHPDDPPFPSIYYEDLATTPRILMRAAMVAVTRKTYYHYCLRSDSITGDFGAKNVFSFAAAVDILRRDLHADGRFDAWQRSYRGLLREAAWMMSIQVLLQRNRIPLGARGPLLARYLRRLRELAERPTDGHRLRAVKLRGTGARSSLGRRVVSGAAAVARPRSVRS